MERSGIQRRRILLGGAAGIGLAGTAVVAGAGPAAAATVSLDWYNVTDAAYGAVGDGTTDATAAIQKALTAAGAAGGGVVYFPYGHYLISAALTAPSGTMLLGECGFGMYPSGSTGGAAPTLVAAAAFSGAAAITLDGSTTALNSIRIEGLVLNGSNLTTGTTAGVLLNGSVTNVVLRDVVASTFPGTGFSLQLANEANPVAYFERCTAWRNGGHGFDLYTTDCQVDACMAFENTLHGFNLQHADDVQFTACRAEHNGENGYTYADASATSTILFDACTTDQNNQNGIAVTGAAGNGPVQITGCSLRRDGNGAGAGSTTYAGIAVTGSTIPVVVTGTNVQALRGDSGGYGPHYALRMSGSSTAVSVVGGYLGCEAGGSVYSWDGVGSLQVGSGVLTGVNDNSGFPGTTTTSAPPSPFGAPPPSANGLLAWTADPWVAPTSASAGVAGYLYLNAVYIHCPAPTSKVWFQVGTAGAGASSGENWAGLYTAAGTLVAKAAIDAAATASGLHSFAWSTAVTLQPGMYWIGIVFNASTMPQLYRSSSTLLAAMNANLGAASYRTCIAAGGSVQTGLPATITPSANVQTVSANDAQPYWVAIG
jgi:hypothetical protein